MSFGLVPAPNGGLIRTKPLQAGAGVVGVPPGSAGVVADQASFRKGFVIGAVAGGGATLLLTALARLVWRGEE